MKARFLLLWLLLIFAARNAECQETVFALLKNDLKLGDEYFEEKKFQNALRLYLNIAKKSPGKKDIYLRIARSYHFLKQYDKAIEAYEKFEKDKRQLSLTDICYYAEAQSATADYSKAIESYQDYLSKVPDDQLIIKKIWRLNNVQFLYEDSLHYAVRPIQFNTEYGELCPVSYQDGLVFMSNRKEVQVIDKLDALQTPFYKLYRAKAFPDSISNKEGFHFGIPFIFSNKFNRRFHAGPISFYEGEKKMVFTSSGTKTQNNKSSTLQLYFAEERNGDWKITHAFPYNNKYHSVSDPSISKDGKTIYFSSDMKGGFGGKDLYRSEFIGGQWTKPTNLGEMINTIQDEVFPYLQDKTLYFSSNGHPGLGGLDIFKVDIHESSFSEPENAGYPLNTNYDDFGIVVDSLDTHGYFSSNRKRGGYNDDIYEFDMDLQTYPLEISGVIRSKEHSWSDSSELKIMPHAKVYLVDNIRNVIVYENTSDAAGNFSLIIPYFSKYKIKVVERENDENIVSLEIPKHRKLQSEHEIVIVKDVFKPD